MRSTHLVVALAACVWIAPASSARAQTPADPAGHWEGKIEIPSQTLNLAVDLARNAAGVWIGSLSIPGTTTTDVPLDSIAIEAASVKFAAGLPGKTTFDGSLGADGLSGSVANAQGAVPFHLTRSGDANVKLPPASSPLSKVFEGSWEGALEVQGKSLRLVLKLTRAADGTAVGSLVSLDQGNLEIPVTTVTLEPAAMKLDEIGRAHV